jgi:hypothetical protein
MLLPISMETQLIVYSLPRLVSLVAVHLEYCFGWPLKSAWQGYAAAGPQGQLALVSASGELVRFGAESDHSVGYERRQNRGRVLRFASFPFFS